VGKQGKIRVSRDSQIGTDVAKALIKHELKTFAQ
jgi:hypothetical protein